MWRRISLTLAAVLIAACGRRPDDDLITVRIKAGFFGDPELKVLDLHVQSNEGRVTLAGFVPNAETRLKAHQVAMSTDGVAAVLNYLMVAPPPPPIAVVQAASTPPKSAPRPPLPPPEPVAASAALPAPEPPPPTPPALVQPRVFRPRTVAMRAEPVRAVPAMPAPDSLQSPEMGAAVAVVTQPVLMPYRRSSGSAPVTRLLAAGGTFPAPIYQRWFEEFQSGHPHFEIAWGGGGSGAGVAQLLAGAADFGASDVPVQDSQFSGAHATILQFPAVLGGVAVVTNLPGVRSLNLTGEVLADILLGRITQWSDPAIARWNSGAVLPAESIIGVRRSDGSATTYVFTDYLSKISPEFKARVGTNSKAAWPVEGPSANQNPGVADVIKRTPYSIGYVDLIYALQNRMAVSRIRNRAGAFLEPSLNSLTAAAAAVANHAPQDLRASLVDAPGKDSYPMATYTWLLVPAHFNDPAKRHAMSEFLSWMLSTGQSDAPALGYGSLPPQVIGLEERQLSQLR
jgi:phosphate transport system substrate-binding protein